MKNPNTKVNRGDILVPLSVTDLQRFVDDISSELDSDSLFPETVDIDDPRQVLSAWREFSPAYVEQHRAYNARCVSEGKTDMLFSRRQAEETRAMHDESADLLERLLAYLPKQEEAHV